MVPNRQFSLMRTVGKAIVFVTFWGSLSLRLLTLKLVSSIHTTYSGFSLYSPSRKCGSDAEV